MCDRCNMRLPLSSPQAGACPVPACWQSLSPQPSLLCAVCCQQGDLNLHSDLLPSDMEITAHLVNPKTIMSPHGDPTRKRMPLMPALMRASDTCLDGYRCCMGRATLTSELPTRCSTILRMTSTPLLPLDQACCPSICPDCCPKCFCLCCFRCCPQPCPADARHPLTICKCLIAFLSDPTPLLLLPLHQALC